MSAPAPPLVDLARVSKVYPRGGGDVVALDGVTLSIASGEKVIADKLESTRVIGAAHGGCSRYLRSMA